MRKLILFILIPAAVFSSCSKKEQDTQPRTISGADSVKTFNLTDNQKKVLQGAKKCLDAKFSYDNEMAYHILKYKDGVNTGSKVFPGGDLDPELGVCTDVTVRALRWGSICDLQEEIYNDVKSHWGDYPMGRWKAKAPDQNIDHRRVPVQMVWFSKYWSTIDGEDYLPGDVVAWDMNGDGWGDHIGIVSDKTDNGKVYLIHNFPSPGYVAEEDVLNRWEIIGHYRIKE